jgi:hypothetical protein
LTVEGGQVQQAPDLRKGQLLKTVQNHDRAELRRQRRDSLVQRAVPLVRLDYLFGQRVGIGDGRYQRLFLLPVFPRERGERNRGVPAQATQFIQARSETVVNSPGRER